jgi:nitrite reductase/ring-hydroxylating ferredoxin subunit
VDKKEWVSIRERRNSMEKIANLKDIKKGSALNFTYEGEKAILIRTKQDDLVAYVAVCPHLGGNIEWDEKMNMLVCETHLSLFNVEDGSLYRHSTSFELDKGLTKIEVSVDDKDNILVP